MNDNSSIVAVILIILFTILTIVVCHIADDLKVKLRDAEARFASMKQSRTLAADAVAKVREAQEAQDEQNKRRVEVMERTLRSHDDWSATVLPYDVRRLLEGDTSGGGDVSSSSDVAR